MAEKKRAGGVSSEALRRMISRADAGLLVELVLKQCAKDDTFRLEALSVLGASGDDELAAIKNMLKKTIRKNSKYGGLDAKGIRAVCKDMAAALDKARRRMERGQYQDAINIVCYIIASCAEVFEKAYNGCSYLADTAETALGMIRECTAVLAAAGNAEEKREPTRVFLQAAQDAVFDEWLDYRYALLEQAALLADSESAGEIHGLLDKLQDGGHMDRARQIRYRLINTVEGPEAAREYLEQNLDVDELRLIAIRQDMERGSYANAERLCLEKTETEEIKKQTVYVYYSRHDCARPVDWNYLLFEIYEKWGHEDGKRRQARRLFLSGDWKYYDILKNLLIKDGKWQDEYQKLREELREEMKKKRSPRDYMELLEKEQETELLMEQLRLYPSYSFQYGALLAAQYGEEVFAMCEKRIREEMARAGNRKEYQSVCSLIKALDSFGGREAARKLIDELEREYPRRPSLLEELNHTRQQLAK